MTSTESGWYILPIFVFEGRITSDSESQETDYIEGRISSTVAASASSRSSPSVKENVQKDLLSHRLRMVTCNASFMEQRFKPLSLV